MLYIPTLDLILVYARQFASGNMQTSTGHHGGQMEVQCATDDAREPGSFFVDAEQALKRDASSSGIHLILGSDPPRSVCNRSMSGVYNLQLKALVWNEEYRGLSRIGAFIYC